MKNSINGIGKVFSFTTKMTVSSAGWRRTTVVLALVLILVPVLIFGLSTYFASDSDGASADVPAFGGSLKTVYVADMTEGEFDYSTLGAYDGKYSDITYEKCGSFEEASALANSDMNSAVMYITSDGGYSVDIVKPDESSVTENDLSLFSDFISSAFYYVTVQKSGLSSEELEELSVPTEIIITDAGSESDKSEHEAEEAETTEAEIEENSTVRMVMRAVLPYVSVMFMYFFVLFYGQSAAQLVVVEKTSKLMDTVLVSVAPHAMIYGKMLACVFCAIIQLSVWILSLLLGVFAGGKISCLIDPRNGIDVFAFITESGILKGMFSPAGIILALIITVSGCILYCSLASVGGALAGKQEDLQSTNILFTTAIVLSLLVIIFGGGDFSSTGMISDAEWLNWIPFTAVLVTPARVLIGDVSIFTAIGSLAVILLFSAAIMYLAGRIYKMMSFYKGSAPKITQVFSMLKDK